MNTRRFLLFAPDLFGPLSSKTANGIIRFRPAEVVAVYDPSKDGQTAQEVLGYGGDIPIVGSLESAMEYNPDTLVVGIAPSGGRLRPGWFPILVAALEAGMEVWSGLHDFLADYPEMESYKSKIWDLRRPPKELQVAKGHWRQRKSKVLLTIGADCNIGKMTASLTLQKQLEAMGLDSVFIGTGQTGIALSGRGVAVDAVVSDFINGAIETEIMKVDGQAPLIIVEGQGAMTHQGFSAVTAGLIHGSMPDFMLLVHQPSRLQDDFGMAIPDLEYLIDLHELLLVPFSGGQVVGVSVYSKDMSEGESKKETQRMEAELEMIVEDMVRLPSLRLAKHIKSLVEN